MTQSSFDVQVEGPDHIMVRFDTVEYRIPYETARVWLRAFKDELDGKERGTQNAPDISYVGGFDGYDDLYSISVSGNHPEHGEGRFLQTAYLTERKLLRLIADIDSALAYE